MSPSKGFVKGRRFKVVAASAVLLVLLHLVPIPPVGSPVEELALPGSKFVAVHDIKVHYVEAGRGDVLIVLLHGFGASVYSWREVLGELSSLGRVVAFDRPGFGLTERVEPWRTPVNPYHVSGAVTITCEFIKAVMMGETKIVLVGHSAGGGIALLAASRCELPIVGLVLVSPSWRPYGRPLYVRAVLELPLAEKYGPLLVRLMVRQLEHVLRRAWFNKTKLTDEVLEGYRYPLRARDWDRGLYWLIKYGEFPRIHEELSRLRQPVLIVHGEDDEIVPLDQSRELYHLLRPYVPVELEVVDDCGHLQHEERPDAFVVSVSRFIRRVATGELGAG